MGFNPAQIAQVSLAGQIGGALTATAGSFFGAQAGQSALNSQANLAEINAKLSELSAQSTLQAGEKEVGRLTLRAGALKGSQKAAMAANGIDIGVGSAAETLASTDILKEIDKNQITANAVRNAWGLRTQASNYRNEALVKRASASAISPLAAAGTTLLGSATKVAESWYEMEKAGLDVVNASDDPLGTFGKQKGWW